MPVRTVGNDLARAILAKHPKSSTAQLARMLRKLHGDVFITDNQADLMVRRIRGAQGKRNRVIEKDQVIRDKKEADRCEKWGALLPEPDDEGFEWHDVSDEASRYLILCDLHIPYHDKKALAAAIAHADGNCDGLILLGDIPDAYQLSSFARDPKKRSFGKEVLMVQQFLDAIEKLGFKKKYYKIGNHDLRLERYLMARNPEIPELVSEFSYRKQLHLDQRGYHYVPSSHPMRHGKLTLCHGHEWGNRFANPVNPARGAFLKANDCTIEGHCHRSSSHTETSLNGRVTQNWSIGCMCHLNPEYRPLGNKWNHGFAYLNTGRDWTIDNHRVIDGKVK